MHVVGTLISRVGSAVLRPSCFCTIISCYVPPHSSQTPIYDEAYS